MYDICCIGHLTLDKLVTPKTLLHMPGGTSFYFSNAICNMNLQYVLVTSLAKKDMGFVTDLREKGIEVQVYPSKKTLYFENRYSHNMDHRTQRVLQTAGAFTVEQVKNIDASIYHLGPLLAGDIPLELIKVLAKKGRVALDVQGYLRKVEHKEVQAIDWQDKIEALKYVDILKANEYEMEVLTGSKDPYEAARLLSNWGVKEVVITLGSLGSVIYAGGNFYDIPAYPPSAMADATGCGDTYMAGYLYQRIKNASFQEAGEFGAAMASLKIESPGAFNGRHEDVATMLYNNKKPGKSISLRA